MSAGVCGKRLGFEEIFGSSATTPAAKRSRCSQFGSPIRSLDLSFGPDDKLQVLLKMFPNMDREVVETVLNTHGHRIDDAIKSLQVLCLNDASETSESLGHESMFTANEQFVEGGEPTLSPEKVGGSQNNISEESVVPQNCSWVDFLVQEMQKATGLDDARVRVMRFLESFEKSVVAHSTASVEQEMTALKEQLQSLLKDNHILKKAVAIQHERSMEQEEKRKEVEQLKHIISQYQEQVRTLEVNNYTLRLHLQRAQEPSSIPGHFHPDVF
ncbi:hypothetical protein QJS10_CPB20g00964 [Acorus calamus]|uniref:CUE domain-containing protein n=1 Tax=Acorus calamus TaxID=4465 RepID=A0AAV9CB22_ACOCL|nr:hypothetical protein QJS10_CPB20g00964 [Acorus calamus]